MQIVMRPTESLIPYARNPRRNDSVVSRMVASIQEFGFKVPVLAKSDGTVIDGHLRLKAADKLKIREVPVIYCDEWTDAQVKAFRLMANRSVSWAEWDEGLLRLELEDLKDFDFDLQLTGFDPTEISLLLEPAASQGLTDPDDIPDIPEVPVTVPGDLWILGKHRLLCGDSTVAEGVVRLLNGVQPILMVTDPPYGVDYDPAWRQLGWAGARATGKVQNDDRVDWKEVFALFPGDITYVWHAGVYAGDVAQSLQSCGFELRSQIIWAKQHFVISRGAYHWQHEPCWYAVRKGRTGNWSGDRKQTTLWQIANQSAFGGQKEDAATKHGTQKPVECMRRPILNHTNPGQCVYDPFLGSGTTIVAAESTGRICFGMEIDPVYVDVAVTRWQNFTGKKAILEGDGKTFEEVKAGRNGAVSLLSAEDIQTGIKSHMGVR
jgi:DNA modification methylase